MPGRRPLEGLRVVVTRPQGRGAYFAAALRSHGALPILIPCVRIEPIDPVPGLEVAIRRLDGYHWLIFTSAAGVELFWDWLDRFEAGWRAPDGVQFAAIGPATAEALRDRGVEPDFVPADYVGEALGEGLPQAAGKRILLPRAAGSRSALPEILERRGALVAEFHLYRAAAIELDPTALRALGRGVDALTFTSPSTVRAFESQLRAAGLDPAQLSGDPICACIGPITAAAAEGAGLAPQVVAQDYTVDGLVEALSAYYHQGQLAE